MCQLVIPHRHSRKGFTDSPGDSGCSHLGIIKLIAPESRLSTLCNLSDFCAYAEKGSVRFVIVPKVKLISYPAMSDHGMLCLAHHSEEWIASFNTDSETELPLMQT